MLRRFVWILVAFPVAVLLVTLAVANRHGVRLVLDPFRSDEPVLFLVLPFYAYLFGVLLLGIVIGGLTVWLTQARWRRTARRRTAEAQRWRAEADRLTRERRSGCYEPTSGASEPLNAVDAFRLAELPARCVCGGAARKRLRTHDPKPHARSDEHRPCRGNVSIPAAVVHHWYPRECCRDNDCAPVERAERLPDGSLRLTSRVGTTVVLVSFPRQPSPDGQMHICMIRYSHFDDMRPVCLFVPPAMTPSSHLDAVGQSRLGAVLVTAKAYGHGHQSQDLRAQDARRRSRRRSPGGADYVGLVFFPPSPRNVAPAAAKALAAKARGRAKIVALMVDPDDALIDTVMASVDAGSSAAARRGDAASAWPRSAAAGRKPVMKAIKVETAQDAARRARLPRGRRPDPVRRPRARGQHAARRQRRALRLARACAASRTRLPFMLSGGLTPDNVAEAIRATGAAIVDVSSGVERRPGEKDPELIRRFLRRQRAYNVMPVRWREPAWLDRCAGRCVDASTGGMARWQRARRNRPTTAQHLSRRPRRAGLLRPVRRPLRRRDADAADPRAGARLRRGQARSRRSSRSSTTSTPTTPAGRARSISPSG